MARQPSPPWRRAFLRVLRRTGNVRLAAKAAGVDHGTAYYHRRRDAGFAGRWAAALGAVRGGKKGAPLDFARDERSREDSPPPHVVRSRTGSVASPPRFSPGNPGEDLVVRPSKRAGVQLVRAGPGRWSGRGEAAFLAELMESANVRAACRAAGFSTTTVYNRRARDEAFRARWDAARTAARERLDLMLVAAAMAALDPEIEVPDDLPRASIAEAIAILRLTPRPKGGGADYEPVPVEQVRATILRRLDAIAAHGGGGGAEQELSSPESDAQSRD